jgi:limonene-1,2-epoxide hydrolase
VTTDRNSHPPHAQWDRIDALLQPWRDNDIPGIAATFTEDGVLHSMMGTPIRGRASILKVLSKHLARIERIEFEIRTIATTGDTVILERVDHITTPTGSHSMPVVGVLVLQDGKVREWREYFDQAQAAPALASSKAARAEPG